MAMTADWLDPYSNITIRWDVLSWTADGYVSYRTVSGWRLQWTWARKEILWSIFGAQVLTKGDCSRFKGTIPASCTRTPSIADLEANTNLNRKSDGCCKGGVLLTRYQDPNMSTVEFQINVGASGNTNTTILLPKNFTFTVPQGGYSCSSARIVRLTRFVTPDGRRVTEAYATWEVVCSYSEPRGYQKPCCVSASSYQGRKTPCRACACSCRSATKSCSKSSGTAHPSNPPVECTDHMCPININWHFMSNGNGKDRRFLVSISNLNHHANYSNWILMVEHPATSKLISVATAIHHLLPSVSNNKQLLWGIRNYNQVLAPFGGKGSTAKFILTFRGSLAYHNFTTITYLNGDQCGYARNFKINFVPAPPNRFLCWLK